MKRSFLLHITNDYSGSMVYKNLVGELDNLGLPQIVYNPIKEESRVGKNKIELNAKGSEIIYSHILNKTTDRIFYKKKIKKIVKDIESKVDFSKIKMIHAHTWYSDGGVAYLSSQKYNIPYIVAVRNTDLNVHYKYFIQHRKFGSKILNNAARIILIGEYQKMFFDKQMSIGYSNENKMMIIPNGVDSYWIKNAESFVHKTENAPFKILYVGTFIKRKKLVELQKAIIDISEENKIVCQLHIVGGGGKQTKEILDNVDKHPDLFIYYGKIYDKNELKDIYSNSHIFAMPSKHETFGLVYVEAMLQGLPILYTANEGIDGFYEEKIGEKVISSEVEEIKQKVLELIKNYDSYTIPTQKLIENHNWKNIAQIYQEIYNKEQ